MGGCDMKRTISPINSAPEEHLKILSIDSWLKPYEKDISLRMKRYREMKKAIVGETGSLRDFANGHHYFGIHKVSDGWLYREWAPAADAPENPTPRRR